MLASLAGNGTQSGTPVLATTMPGLGLINRPFDTDDLPESRENLEETLRPWERFKLYVDHLNRRDAKTATYKVLYVTRHGKGYHNEFESKVGRYAWNVRLTQGPS